MLQESEDMMIEDDDYDGKPQLRYYKSNKVLGHLYRNIDEKEFLEEIRDTRRNTTGSKAVLQSVWQYIENETKGFQWEHLVDAVSDIQGMYVVFYLVPLFDFQCVKTFSCCLSVLCDPSRLVLIGRLLQLRRQYARANAEVFENAMETVYIRIRGLHRCYPGAEPQTEQAGQRSVARDARW